MMNEILDKARKDRIELDWINKTLREMINTSHMSDREVADFIEKAFPSFCPLDPKAINSDIHSLVGDLICLAVWGSGSKK
jgi:hypothetical protein